MGRADEYQFDYLDDNVRFADQVNGALFQGEQVLKPEELSPADAQMVYLGKEAGVRENVKTIADKTRMWKGNVIHILTVENQSYVDYGMVLRNMLTESLSYHRQWKKKKRNHSREQDLEAGSDAFLSGISKQEKFTPVIILVVYCGTEHPWDGAKCLYDLLQIDERLKPYVSNYRLNLYDCHEHDTFDEYHTGLRQLFEMLRYRSDKEQMKEVIEQSKEIYSSMDHETRELLEVVAGVKIPEEYRIAEKGEEHMAASSKWGDGSNVCKAWADYRLEGVEEGMQKGMLQHLIKLVCRKLQKNKSAETIAKELEEELSEVEKVIEAQKKVGTYDVEEICKVMVS